MDKMMTSLLIKGEIDKLKGSMNVIIENTPEKLDMIEKYEDMIRRLELVKLYLKKI